MKQEIDAIDLFCGAGGLTRGLLEAGINVRAGVDCDPACRYPYAHNNNSFFLEKKIEDLKAKELTTYFDDSKIRLLAGCAPCQPFSKYSQGRDTSKDDKWGLLHHFAKLIKQLKPELVTMENVPEVIKHSVFSDFIDELKKLKYHLDYKVVDCRYYGLPQSRHRLVLIASKLGEIKIPKATHNEENFISVKDAIGSLPKLKAGQQDKNDPLHICARLSELNLTRIRQSKPGGTWRDWDPELVAACHQGEKGKTYGSVYGRMTWDAPAPTMTTQCFGFGNGRFGHPKQDRAISLREAAIFQSFPPDYQFTAPDGQVYMKVVGRLIGNAVPVRLGEVIGKTLVEHTKLHTSFH
ncbi:DNA (cytosine-5-)-methyltransferase [Endozoicomonas sp. OPT23]|uniref:DNA cytosine methyltransferase n=1 Tax=Endozoicomonas sp. OPT23 TaxID=2072845 RepID=UPI00129B8210|nr:DNA cytosine methyltransferase [Endozoicomonas sp. OPT23]MRI31384.1 DNA (cytosine-5-)-methyltransferase [Endozoicomonas sp. OPT23]